MILEGGNECRQLYAPKTPRGTGEFYQSVQRRLRIIIQIAREISRAINRMVLVINNFTEKVENQTLRNRPLFGIDVQKDFGGL
ncbi:hypothetical protein WK99_24125 [Burkholderia ubonensis]|nr:hypothetical protein WK99_24125 [Burkholderia ubonensis]